MPQHSMSSDDFLLERPYGGAFKKAVDAYYKASLVWFYDDRAHEHLSSDAIEHAMTSFDAKKLDLSNKLFYEAFEGDYNHFEPHIFEGNISLRRRHDATANRPNRPTLLMAQIVSRTRVLENRIQRAKPAHLKTGNSKFDNVVLLFSPLFFVRRFLTDPEFPASEAYVHALIRARIFSDAASAYAASADKVSPEAAREFIATQITFSKVSECLQKIQSHWRQRDNFSASNATDFIVMQLLASQNYLIFRLGERGSPRNRKNASTKDEKFRISRYQFLSDMTLLPKNGMLEYRVLPEVRRLPSATELMNQLDGIPIPLTGLDQILHGGLRLSANHGLVWRCSGPSGSGKTSFALGLSIALAPLGTNTIYLSCEERPEDLSQRIQTLIPSHLRRMEVFSRSSDTFFVGEYIDGKDTAKLEDTESFLYGLSDRITPHDPNSYFPIPGICDLLIVIDGAHELFEDGSDTGAEKGAKLRGFIEACRDLGALVLILTARSSNDALDGLDYLVDVVSSLDIASDELADTDPIRRFNLRKTRRQIAQIGTHLLHISGQRGARIAPNLATQSSVGRNWKWGEAKDSTYIDFLLNPVLPGSARAAYRGQAALVYLYDRAQILVTGLGSGGKSAFGMRILSAPVVSARNFGPDELPIFRQLSMPRRREVLGTSKSLFDPTTGIDPDDDVDVAEELANEQLDAYSAGEGELNYFTNRNRRSLIVSFLYPEGYYRKLWSAMQSTVTRGADKRDAKNKPKFEFDVHTFSPGYLHAEDFLRIVQRLLDRRELLGTPYHSIMIDGLHNVYLQFPHLERNEMVWAILYQMLRTRGLTVVTTHTYFTIDPGMEGERLEADIESARRRVAPLLHALVQATDFNIRITPEPESDTLREKQHLYKVSTNLRVDILGAFGQNAKKSNVYWDRESFLSLRLPDVIRSNRQ